MANKKEISVQINVGANLEDVQKRLTGLQNKLDKLSLPASVRNEFLGLFSAMDRELEKISQKTAGGKLKLIDSASVGKSVEKIDSLYSALIQKFESRGIATAALKQDQNAISAITSALKVYADSTKSILSEEKKLTAEVQKQERAKEALLEKHKEQKVVSDAELAAQKERVSAATKEANAKAKAVTAARQALEEKIAKSGGTYKLSDIDEKGSPLRKTKAYKEYKAATEASGAANKIKKSEADKFASMTTFEQQKKDIQEVELRITKAKDKLQEFNNTQKATKEIEAFEEVKRQLAELENIDLSKYGVDLAEIKNIEQLEKALEKVKIAAQNSAEAFGKEYAQEMKDAGASTNRLEKDVKDATDAVEDLDERTSQINAMQERVKSFLGVSGAAQVMRSALRDAMQTITELDATMTEMAVVTDLSVGDYWNQLPQYSKQASDLGVSINSAYKAATLYYQQGLKSNEVTKISAETLKMARIAGLSAEDATNKMTAALRGFNMELNETSAQRVSDVYSELAAITASDVDEISSAMTKTASIASSAGMEFETTAAFLSQIIETTRESAETAGTALKTVIARFQELKKDPSEIGEIDGEIVDANKIETALRSVGVALRDSSGQFRDLDEVFLELSQKWDTLDTNTQRYIATIAAGSRQQSRFIAMMSDYGRTQELATAANNSAGASNKQFEKTLDSLESKLAKLENAWHEFTMGILESDLVKFGVDILTKFLEIINKGTNAFDGLAGSLTKIFSVLSIFKLGMKVFNKFKDPIFSLFGEITNEAGKSGYSSAKKWHEGAKEYWREQNQTAEKKTEEDVNNQSKQDGPGIGGWRAFKSAGEAKKQRDQARIDMDAAKSLMDPQGPSKEEYLAAKAGLEEIDKNYTFNSKNGLAYKKGKKGKQSKQSEAVTNAIKKRQEELNKTIKKYEEIEAASDDYHKAEESYAIASEKQWQSITSGISAAADATAAVGMGLSMLGGLLSNLGFEEAGEGIAMIGSGLTIAGSIVSTLIPLVSALGSVTWAALAPILPIILAVVAAVGLLAAGIYAVWKASPQAALKEAEKAANDAADAAQRAAKEYDNIKTSFDELQEKYDKLKELTRGTLEWRDAVQDTNKTILQLISTYPKLSKFVEVKDGILTIDFEREEVQNVLAESKKGSVIAENVSTYKQLEERKRELALKRSKLEYRDYVNVSDEQYDEIALAIATGKIKIGENEEENKQNLKEYLAESLKLEDSNYAEFIAEDILWPEHMSEIRNYGQELLEDMSSQEVAYDAIASSAWQLADALNMSAEEIRQGENLANGAVYKNLYEEELNKQKEDASRFKEVSDREGMKQAIETYYGEGASFDFATQTVTYKDGDKTKTENITLDEAQEIVSHTNAAEKTAEGYEYATEATSALRKYLGQETTKNLSLDPEGGTLTRDNLEKISSVLGGDFSPEDWLKLTTKEKKTVALQEGGLSKNVIQAWDTLDAKEKLAYGNDITLLVDWLARGLAIGNEKFLKSQSLLSEITSENFSNVNADTATNLATITKEVATWSGTDEAKGFFDLLNAATGDPGSKKEDKEKFTSVVGGLVEAQGYKNKEQWEQIIPTLEKMGVTVTENMRKAVELGMQGINSKYSDTYLKSLGVSEELISHYQNAEGEDLKAFHKTFTKWKDYYETANDKGEKTRNDLVREVVDAIIEGYEEQINAQEELNETIGEANDKMLSFLSKKIEEDRWARENDETERGLRDQRSKLAYLVQDTSGSNALDILNLQKDITGAEQTYQDSLIDQSLQKLEDANAKAAEQREQQIELARAQLEAYGNSKEILAEAERIVDQAMDDLINGKSLEETELGKLLYTKDAITNYEANEFWNQLYAKVSAAIKGEELKGGPTPPPDNEKKATEIMSTYRNKMQTIVDAQYLMDDNQIRSNADISVAYSNYRDAMTKAGLSSLIVDFKDFLLKLQKADPTGLANLTGSMGLTAMKTGGLADFTGPAWLDGTKSRPEYVLNAAQTERFFSLVDVLDSLDTNKAITDKQSGGDNHFDIEINVEKLENDYDVEQLADKIRRMIYEDASYRNVNTVSLR